VLFDDPGPDYQLIWPLDVFAGELRAVRDQFGARSGEVELVLLEAFAGDGPRDDLNRVGWRKLDLAAPGWAGCNDGAADPAFVRLLLEHADRLPDYRRPRPYWAARHGTPEEQHRASSDLQRLRQDWHELFIEFADRGYLDKIAPKQCVDDDGERPDADTLLSREVAARLGTANTWSSSPDSWDDATLFSLIEVFHDLVARPRRRYYHDYGGCGWHYSNFAYKPGRSLYRWKVNQILADPGIDFELAESGEDVGRLVHGPSDPRRDLTAQAISSPVAAPDPIRHAVALFRARSAGREEKRSACIALAGVLEQRRSQLKVELLSKDEGALFHIANQFDVRHRNADQRGDYDEAYLEWIFWWYLATIELTNQLVASAPSEKRGAPIPSDNGQVAPNAYK
jgi:hypothetical protein